MNDPEKVSPSQSAKRTAPVFTPWDPEVERDPYPQFADLRERDPVHRFEAVTGWVITRADDCAAVLSDERFSSRVHDSTFERSQRFDFPTEEQNRAVEEFFGRSMLFSDAERHHALRTAVRDEFSARAIRALEPRLRTSVDAAIDELPVGREFDFVSTYAELLPLRAILLVLGIGVDDEKRLKALIAGIGPLMDIIKSPDQRRYAAECLVELRSWARGRIAAGEYAGVGLVARLVSLRRSGGISESDLLGMLSLLLVTGSETTTNLLGSLAFFLGNDPQMFARLQEGPGTDIAGFVDEVLRLAPPVMGVARVARERVVLRDREIEPGDYVVVATSAANRDSTEKRRGCPSHLSFGHGKHRCLGAHLAALEAELTVKALIGRFDGFEAESAPEMKATQVLRGPRALRTILRQASVDRGTTAKKSSGAGRGALGTA